MTKREQKLVFENEEFIDLLYKKYPHKNTKEMIYIISIYCKFPHTLFLDLEQFICEKFNAKITWWGNIKSVSVYYNHQPPEEFDYKTKWTGLLSVCEWLIKEESK